MNDVDVIRGNLSTAELMAQLAEECLELGHVALKIRRGITQDNPTPVKLSDAYENLMEEIADVALVLDVLGYDLNDLKNSYNHGHKETAVGKKAERQRKNGR